ncbi:MAG: iron ABC transporter permease [Candidatus Thorarchaeota archaeon]
MTEADEIQRDAEESELQQPHHPLVNFLLSFFGGIARFLASIGNRIKSIFVSLWNMIVQIGGFLKSPRKNASSLKRGLSETVKSGWSRFRREMDTLSMIQLIAILVVFGAFLIAPLLSVVWGSFFTEDGFTLDIVLNLFTNKKYVPQWRAEDFDFIQYNPDAGIRYIYGIEMGIILNSIYSAVMTTTIAVILGTSFAFLMARYDFTGKNILRTLLLFPMLSTPFIGAIGIKWFLGSYGVLNNMASELFAFFGMTWIRTEFRGLAAIVIVQGLSLFSLVYLNAYSSFMGIDPSLEEQAENLGASGFQLFRTVTLPLAMPGIQAGAILTFILSIEDLGTPIVYAEDPQAQRVLAYQVFDSIAAESGSIDPLGPAIGMLLLLFALVGFLAIRKYASLRSYASTSKGGQWNPRTRTLTKKTTALMYMVLIPVLFYALIPQLSILLLSVSKYRSSSIIPVFTLNHYNVLGDPKVQGALFRTLGYAAVATFIIVLLGVSAAYIISRRDIPGRTGLDLLVTSPIALPGIVIATGYFTLFYNTPIFPMDMPMFLIIISYTVRKFPFTVRAAYAGLQQTPEVLEEASMSAGANRNQTFARIVIPLIGVSVLAGSLLSFVYSVSEVSTSILLGSANYYQAPLTYWVKDVMAGLPPLYGHGPAAVLGVVMMLLQMVVIAITNAVLKTRASAMTGI